MSDADVPDSPLSLSERLSQWIDWTRALAVSTALDGRLPAVNREGPQFDPSEDPEYAQARSAVELRIRQWQRPDMATDSAGPVVDYAPFGKHYLEMQRAMHTASGRLRGRLRDMLARQSLEMARLAEMDAVMELILSPREQALLATVPALLGRHFERLQLNALADADAAPDSAPLWLPRFHIDMQSVLRAELDVRFQPIDALLAALRTR